VDVIRTTADLARARAEADAAARAVSAAAARLAPWLGLDAPLSIRATGPIDIGTLPSEAEAMSHLLAQHPALRRDRAEVEAAAAHVRTEQRSRWPLVNTDLSVAQADPTVPGTDVVVGISFEVPVLNLRGGAIDRARARQALAQTTAAADLRRLAADLIAAYRESEGAAVRTRALTDAVLPGLAEARQMIEGGYRDGRVDLFRVLEAQTAVREARLAQVEAQATWQRALADVERDIGVTDRQGTTGDR
jgi:cobalt-zinc-cadmium efflux system outer membrane protein